MIWLGFQTAFRERLRFALTVGGVTSAVVLTVFLIGVYQGAVLGSLSWVEDIDADVWVGGRGNWNLLRTSGFVGRDVIASLETREDVEIVEPIVVALLPAGPVDQRRTLLFVGLEESAELAVPQRVVEGRALPKPGEIVIDRAYARRAGLSCGDELNVAGVPVTVVGITEGTNLLVTHYAFVSGKQLRTLAGLGERWSFVLVKTSNGHPGEIVAEIDGRPGTNAFDRATFIANNRQEVAAGFAPVMWTMAFLGIVAGVVVVALTIHAAVLERRQDYALLAALGGTKIHRMLVVAQQALAAGLVGSTVGTLVLLVIQQILPHLVPEIEFRLQWPLASAAFGGAVLVALAGALVPGWLAIRIPPMEVLRK